ncbi:MAG: class I SAM-dependent methyltransferase [Gammaproteobacteria bacterium]
MSNRSINLTDRTYQYMLDVSLREAPILADLREATASHPKVVMQISPEQGQFMAMLVKLIGARRCVEVGVFTGYSSLAVALALPTDGHIVACDISEEFTRLALEYWELAGVESKIKLEIAPATDTLDQLLSEGQDGEFDFAFIDADKVNYRHYYDRLLKLVRKGGLIAVDNTLWSGDLADPDIQDEDTVALREFNQYLHGDDRIDLSLLPIGDGLTLARKR